MSTILTLLAKVNRLKREALAAQPVDPLACLSGDQRRYFKRWVEKLHSENSETAGGAYAALLNRKHWTVFEWLCVPIINAEMTEDAVGRLYNDYRDGVK